jgi:hypothetical protein
MCGAESDPTTYDSPSRPRRHVVSGDEPRPSIALAVLGDELERAEAVLAEVERAKAGPTAIAMARAVADALRRARNHVADVEARR